jgi:hypothetical protein
MGLYLNDAAIRNIEAPKEPISDQQFNNLAVAVSRFVRRDPFVTAAEFLWKAKRSYIVEGDTRTAVVHAQTSSEMFLDHVLLSMAWEDGRSVEEAAEWFSLTDRITKRVSRFYSQLLPGSWNCSDPCSELGKWATRVTHIRNRVVHAGYEPTLSEAAGAIEATLQLQETLIQRLLARPSKYPRTLLLLAGKPSLEDRGVLSNRLKDFLKQADEEADWVSSRAEWLERFRDARKKED